MTMQVSRLERLWQRLAERENARIRDLFVQNAQATSGSRVALGYLLAGLVVAGYLLGLALGLWMLGSTLGLWSAWGLPRLVSGFIAFLALAMSWQARPRVPQAHGIALTEAEAPQFYALLRQVAAAMQVPMPAEVRLLAEVNAYMGQVGWQRQPVLGLGLPLWFALHPQERVAVLAHELAHLRNGDPARTGLIGITLNMLAQTYHAIMPDTLQRLNTSLVGQITNLLMTGLAQIPYLLYQLLTQLIGAQHQAAEYRADLLAAGVTGSPALLQSLEKLHYADVLDSALHKQRHFPEQPHAFLELRQMWDTMSPQAREQRKAAIYSRPVALDDSHPPTRDRMQVVAAHPTSVQVALAQAQAEAIDRELTPFVKRLEQQAYDEYRERWG